MSDNTEAAKSQERETRGDCCVPCYYGEEAEVEAAGDSCRSQGHDEGAILSGFPFAAEGWKECPHCGESYCPHCGYQAWWQCL